MQQCRNYRDIGQFLEDNIGVPLVRYYIFSYCGFPFLSVIDECAKGVIYLCDKVVLTGKYWLLISFHLLLQQLFKPAARKVAICRVSPCLEVFRNLDKETSRATQVSVQFQAERRQVLRDCLQL